MKTAEYLFTERGWQKYDAPGDSARLKQFVTDKWKGSVALEQYAETYLPMHPLIWGRSFYSPPKASKKKIISWMTVNCSRDSDFC